jgi:hypothetical protein
VDTRELREKYRSFARWYDLAEGFAEAFGVRRLRRSARFRDKYFERP